MPSEITTQINTATSTINDTISALENKNNNFKINEYGDDVDISEEEDNGISIDVTTTFSKYFDSNELRNQEEEITFRH
jgi:hypothetical protein